MKNTFLCIVIFISCSGCAIGDLEFYPDYQRSDFSEEDLVKDGSVNPELQNFLDEQRSSIYQPIRPRLSYLDLYKNKQEDLTWPNTAAHNIFKNEDLARRLTQLSRNLEETNRRPQYYFKTHGLNREQENRYNLYNNIEDQNNGEFIPRFKPNFRILDDIRLNPDEDNSDFSLPSSEIADFPNDRNEDQRNTFSPEIEPVTDKLKPEYLETQTSTDDNPSEFAYPPSDPRFFEDTAPNEVKISSDGDNEEDGRRDNRDSIQLQNRNEYYQQPLADLKDYRSGFDDGGDVVAIKPHSNDDTTGVYIIAIVAGISAAATVGLIAFGIGWYK